MKSMTPFGDAVLTWHRDQIDMLKEIDHLVEGSMPRIKALIGEATLSARLMVIDLASALTALGVILDDLLSRKVLGTGLQLMAHRPTMLRCELLIATFDASDGLPLLRLQAPSLLLKLEQECRNLLGLELDEVPETWRRASG